MGKTVNVIGGMTGKVGNLVYYYRDGEQLVRVYVPRPNNPKSKAQTGSRLRLSLAGKISAVVPADALWGLPGGSKTGRRSSFLRSLIGRIVVGEDGASVADGDIVFSEGMVDVETVHTLAAGTSATAGRKIVNITTSAETTPVPEEGYGERYVVLFLNSTTSGFDYGFTGEVVQPEPGSTAVTGVTVRVGDVSSDYVALVYVVPYVQVTGANGGRFRVTDLGTGEGTVVVDTVTGEVVDSGVVYGKSVFVGRVVFGS